MALKVGTQAPDFVLSADDGASYSLYRDSAGKNLILYFYPRDFTPGCTAEACEFRDTFREFEGAGVEIIGVSRDPVDRHLAFKKKFNIPYKLLSDREGKVCEAYDALIPILRTPRRVSYLIDRDKKIVAVTTNFLNAVAHVTKMQSALEKLRG